MAKKSGRRMPVKTVRANLDGEWEGWWMEVGCDISLALFDRLKAVQDSDPEKYPHQTIEAMCRLLKLIVRKWNFVDAVSQPLPLNDESFTILPLELLGAAVGKVQEVMTRVPLGTKSS